MAEAALRTLISADRIQKRVAELGRQIHADYGQDADLRLIGMLRGACFFLADLARAIEREVSLDFMTAHSYGSDHQSSGVVRITKDLDQEIAGLDVLIVEDIVDTGLTVSHLLEHLQRRRPRSLRVATLLDKPSRRIKPVSLSYIGFEIPNHFVVGYGLDFAERYRNLPDICILDEAADSPA